MPEIVINEKYMMPLLGAMVESLDAEPRVASNICWVGIGIENVPFRIWMT